MQTHTSRHQANSRRSAGVEPQQVEAAPGRAAPPAALTSSHSDFSLSGLGRVSGPRIQPSLSISHPQDRSEIEAERVAEEVVNMPADTVGSPADMEEFEEEESGSELDATTVTGLGRACAECDEEAAPLQRPQDALPSALDRNERHADADVVAPETEAAIHALRGGGDRLAAGTRDFMEPRFNRDFSDVRIHTGDRAARLADSLHARAFTVGHDVVFGAGEYQPTSLDGKHLIAHELTHVVQQGQAPRLVAHGQKSDSLNPVGIDRVASLNAPARKKTQRVGRKRDGVVRRLIVEDSAQRLADGQMTRSQFLDEIKMRLTTATNEGLAGSGRTAADLPYVADWLSRYEKRDAVQIERAARRYMRGMAQPAPTLSGYLDAISSTARDAAARWARAGDLGAVPDGLPQDAIDQWTSAADTGQRQREAAQTAQKQSQHTQSYDVINPAVAQARNVPGADSVEATAENHADLIQSIRDRVGAGSPLDGATRKRMQSAFGASFSDVRIHTNAQASRLATEYGAQAFTIGKDIVFAEGKHHPGTPAGDMLLVHELAHVVQQHNATDQGTETSASTQALEADADRSAVGVLSRLWGEARGFSDKLRDTSLPLLRSGVRLQRCNGDGNCTVPTNFRETLQRKDPGGMLHFEYAWDSSSGSLADLSACEVGEHVAYTQTEDPPFAAAPNPTIMWKPGKDGAFQDNHSPGARKPYKNSTEKATQNYRYHCPCKSSDAPQHMMGPIQLTRKIERKADGNYKYTIKKSGLENEIDPLP